MLLSLHLPLTAAPLPGIPHVGSPLPPAFSGHIRRRSGTQVLELQLPDYPALPAHLVLVRSHSAAPLPFLPDNGWLNLSSLGEAALRSSSSLSLAQSCSEGYANASGSRGASPTSHVIPKWRHRGSLVCVWRPKSHDGFCSQAWGRQRASGPGGGPYPCVRYRFRAGAVAVALGSGEVPVTSLQAPCAGRAHPRRRSRTTCLPGLMHLRST